MADDITTTTSESASGKDLIPVAVQHMGQIFAFWKKDVQNVLARDLDVAAWLGYERPHEFRRLIERHKPSLGEVFVTVTKTPLGGRPGMDNYLTREQVLYLVAKSETPRAVDLLKVMITVFTLAIDGLMQPTHSALQNEVAALRRDVTLLLEERSEQRRSKALKATEPPRTPADLLLARIRSGDLGSCFSARDVYIRHWKGLDQAAVVSAACRELEERGLLQPEHSGGRRGRPSIVYLVLTN